ncbi:hypothetical protein Btru_008402 [Bulinus truncatus]|nr:hypothetical protein Btru_008402 [Bulinus truncatus]
MRTLDVVKCILFLIGCSGHMVDLLQEATTNVSYLVDYADDTCSPLAQKKQNVVHFRFQKAHAFTFMRLVVKQTSNIDEPYITVKLEFSIESNNKLVSCPGMTMWILSSKEVDIFCELEKLFHSVKLTWASQFEVCGVYISAGRNVAVGANVHTTSLFNSATDGTKAVDGDPQTCQMTAMGDLEPEIAILFSSPMVITRFRVISRCDNEANNYKQSKNGSDTVFVIDQPKLLNIETDNNVTSTTPATNATTKPTTTSTTTTAKSTLSTSSASPNTTSITLNTTSAATSTVLKPSSTASPSTTTSTTTTTKATTELRTASKSTTTAATTPAKTSAGRSVYYHLMTYDANGKLMDTIINSSLCIFRDIVLPNAAPISTLTLQMVPESVNSRRVLSVCEFEAYGDCPAGRNGISCEQKCPVNCKDRCSLISGNCQSCARGRFGDRCTIICAKCLHGACDIKGVCHFGCKAGHAGSRCTIACGYCAHDGSCDQRTMVCKGGCLKRYFGSKCDLYCGNCKNASNCTMRLHQCPQGCIAPFTGLYCNETCGGCEKAAMCHQLTQKCPSGCASSFEGKNCKFRLRSAAVIESYRTDEKDSTSIIFVLLITFILTFVAIYSVLTHLRQTTYYRRSS